MRAITILDKFIIDVVLFVIAINFHSIVAWFMNMHNMVMVMLFMTIVMLVNFGWNLINAKY